MNASKFQNDSDKHVSHLVELSKYNNHRMFHYDSSGSIMGINADRVFMKNDTKEYKDHYASIVLGTDLDDWTGKRISTGTKDKDVEVIVYAITIPEPRNDTV